MLSLADSIARICYGHCLEQAVGKNIKANRKIKS